MFFWLMGKKEFVKQTKTSNYASLKFNKNMNRMENWVRLAK